MQPRTMKKTFGTLSPSQDKLHISITYIAHAEGVSAAHSAQHENSVKMMWMLERQSVTGHKIIYLNASLCHTTHSDESYIFSFHFRCQTFYAISMRLSPLQWHSHTYNSNTFFLSLEFFETPLSDQQQHPFNELEEETKKKKKIKCWKQKWHDHLSNS